MNEYVFYTTEGVTLPPKEDEVVDNPKSVIRK